MRSIKEKLQSRKLWAAVAGIITGLAMVFGLDESIITSVAGAVTAAASVVAYILTEGKIDLAALNKELAPALDAVDQAINALEDEKEVTIKAEATE